MSLNTVGGRLAATGLAVAALLAASSPADAAAQAEDAAGELVAALPDGVNAIGVVRVQQLMTTSRAATMGWDERLRSAFMSGTTVFPKWAETVVVGAPVHPGDSGTPWVASVFTGPSTLGVAQLAPGGRADLSELAGKPAFVSRGGAYVIELGPGELAALSPGQRQAAARWVRSIGAGETKPTAFLKDAAATPGDVVLALDMQDMFAPAAVAAFVTDVSGVPAADVEPISQLVTGAEGMGVSINVARDITATLSVRFGQPVDVSSESLGAVLKAALAASGLSLPEVEDAAFTAEGEDLTTTVALSGESFSLLISLLSGLQHAGSEVASDAPAAGPPNVADPNAADPAAADAPPAYDPKATRHYGNEVTDAVKRMSHLKANGTTLKNGLRFLNSTTRRIRDLPTRGVAPAMVERGQAIAAGMAGLAASIQGAAVEVNAAQRAVTWNVDYDPGAVSVGWWGDVGYRPPHTKVDSNLAQVRQSQAQAVAAGADDRAQIWALIEEDDAVVRGFLEELDKQTGGR